MSAMVETLDAQMTDYSNSDDVFMQTHSDPWVQEDGTMDDDSFHFHQTDVSKLPTMDSIVPIEASMSMPFSTISTSNSSLPMGEDHAVEIEMEEYMEDPEYDMVDDEHVEEIHDIEVHDAQTAVAQPIAIAPQISFSFSNETTTSIAEITSLVTPVPSTSRQSPDPTHESSADQLAHPQDDGDSELVEDVVLQAPPTEERPEIPAEVAAIATERVDGANQLNSRDPEEAHFVDETTPDNLRGGVESHGSEQEVPGPPPEEPYTPLTAGIDGLEETVVSTHPEVVSSEVAPVEPHDNPEHSAAEGADPHEISEGVYIDPPPGVLLEVSPSPHLYTMFNRLPHSPSQDQAAEGDTVVVLQDRPTLFYEPMFSLFEALREEEPFSNSPDLRELELIFSFPSLNLVLSEDNIYARQTSLHEVVMLHETFGGLGPLRVRLQFQPRFIIRFSELQSAMEQSAIGSGEEEEAEVHGEGQPHEAVEDAPPEHTEGQPDDPSLHENQQGPQGDNLPVDGEGESHVEAVEHLDSHEFTHPTQGTGEHEFSEVGNNQEPKDLHEEGAEAEGQEPQLLVSGETARLADADETEAGSSVEVHEEDQTFPEELHDGSEGYGEGPHDVDEHAGEDADLVEYVEEFEEDEGEYDHEDHSDSDSTETPGHDHETPQGISTHDSRTTDDHEEKQDEVPQANESVDPPIISRESNGTDDDGLAHDLDEQSAEPTDHPDPQGDAGLVDDYQESGLDGRHPEDSSEEGSEHVEPTDESFYPDFSELPELPEEDDEFWDDEQDGEGEVDQLGEHEYEPIEDNEGSTSNDSSVTLSSKGSKRAYSEVGDEYEEEGDDMHPSTHSPEKRTRLQ